MNRLQPLFLFKRQNFVPVDHKRRWFLLMAMTFVFFVTALPVFAQETDSLESELIFDENFQSENKIWPVGSENRDGLSITRTIDEGSYKWAITSPANNFFRELIPFELPTEDQMISLSLTLEMPALQPSVCSGLVLSEQSDHFYTYVVCNDQTYALLKNENDVWSTAIDFHKVDEYFQGSPVTLRVDMDGGWADFYLDDVLLDTYNIDVDGSSFGLFVQPMSGTQTDIEITNIRATASRSQRENSEMNTDLPVDISRTLKMLMLKERINGVSGSFSELPDYETSLAQMGFYTIYDLGFSSADVLIQSDVAWKSAYEKPDLQNSGCGFVLRYEDQNDFLRVYIAMNGAIYLSAYRNGSEVPIMSYNYGSWNIEGNGTLTIVADEAKISILFDNNLLGTVYNASWMGKGTIGTIVKSGTNMDYGTACSFKNNKVLIFD